MTDPVDKATLIERLRAACWAEDVCDIEPGLLREAAAALSSLETRLENNDAAWSREQSLRIAAEDRALAAEAREKALRKGLESAVFEWEAWMQCAKSGDFSEPTADDWEALASARAALVRGEEKEQDKPKEESDDTGS